MLDCFYSIGAFSKSFQNQKVRVQNSQVGVINGELWHRFGQILSILSQDIEWKLYSDVNQGPLLRLKIVKKNRQQFQARPRHY